MSIKTYLLICILISSLLGLATCDSLIAKDRYWAYVSHYSDEAEAGISIYDWNPKSGELTWVSSDSTVQSSSYLAIDDANDRLYSINAEGVQSFQIDQQTGGLTPINQIPLTGNGACYISISKHQQYLMVAYYSSGTVSTYGLRKDGSIGEEVSRIQHQGPSVNAKRQESAHAHMVIPAPSGDLVYVTDLGMDQVLTYRANESGLLTPEPASTTTLAPGYGPRHLAFHPQQPVVYVLAELTSRVVAYGFDPALGMTTEIGDWSMLPESFTAYNKSADIHLSPNGQWLYASNRGHNSVAVYRVDAQDGTLALAEVLPSGGAWPRAFEVDPSGRYLLIANKRSDAISVMEITADTGLYNKKGEMPVSTSPQCIKFLKR